MKQIEVCPSCSYRYRVPVELNGQTISCKQCGDNFKLALQDEGKQNDQSMAAQSLQEQVADISCDDAYLLIGKLAVKYKYASIQQVKQALVHKEQKSKAGRNLLLGEILVDQGILSQPQLDFLHSVQKLLQTRKSDNEFGIITVKNDFSTQKEIDRALLEQKKIFKETKTVRTIGDILDESGLLKAEQRDAVLIRQKRMDDGAVDEKKKTNKKNAGRQVEHDAKLKLNVSKDQLDAIILPNGEVHDSLTIDDIKSFLENSGIKFGLIDDRHIAAYLENTNNYKKPFKIAEGRPPEPGQDSRIQFCIETDPLKIGAIKKDDAIDFTDRGCFQEVKKGDLIAEKILGQDGSPGMDVYGHPIPAPNPNDKKLRAGQGTEVSEDGLKVFAATDGLLGISLQGKVYVLAQLEISEDVDLKTGHVDFDGKITVDGGIQKGCRAKGHSLSVKEIEKSEVDMIGDILVAGGIINASIKAGGNVRAIYLRESDIKALGDVVVEKEIIDSIIETSGACIIKGGVILSSKVTAKKGIFSMQVGSDVAKPCNLIVGVEELANNEIDRFKRDIASKKEELVKLKSITQALDQKSKDAENDIGELAQLQDRAMVDLRNIKTEIKALKEAEDHVQLASAETVLKEIDAEVKEMDNKMEKLFDLQDQKTTKIATINQENKVYEKEIQALEDNITELAEWSATEKGLPEVIVHDEIFPDTTIDGIHSSLALRRKLKNVLIKEYNAHGPDETPQWQIKVSQL